MHSFAWYVVSMNYLELVKDYSERTGLSVDEIITQALEDWVSTVGSALLDKDPAVSNVIEFPVWRDERQQLVH